MRVETGQRTAMAAVGKLILLYVVIVLALLTAFWIEGRVLMETLP